MCDKMVRLAGYGLILWSLAYTFNSLINVLFIFTAASFSLRVKYVLLRLGTSLAGILFAAMAMHYNCGCCAHGSKCCAGEPDRKQ